MELKKTRGRQKVQMKMMENVRHRLVTFSKRKSGLYKKASELSVLCGAEVAIVTFSPAGTPYVFCTTSAETIIEKFFRPSSSMNADTSLYNGLPNASIHELSQLYSTLLEQEEAQNAYLKELKLRAEKAPHSKCWWNADLNKLSRQELEQMRSWFEDLQRTVSHEIHKRTDGASSSLTPITADLFKLTADMPF